LSRFLLLPVISCGRLCAVPREEDDEEETPTVVKGKTQTYMTAAKVARENSYLKTAKLCFLVQNPDFLALRERERERERYVFMFISSSERKRRPAHMHTISSAQQQKVALTVVLSLHSEAQVQAGLHIRSARLLSFFLPNCPVQKLLQPTDPLRKNFYYHRRSTIQKIIMLAHMPTTSKNKNKNCVLP
jgi:hypothetical protein